jgi:hypothetical protein
MWMSWRQTATFDRLSGIRGTVEAGHLLPVNGWDDLDMLFSPLGPGWTQTDPERLTLLIDDTLNQWGRGNTMRVRQDTAAGHVALFNWRSLDWEERAAPPGSWRQSWDNAQDLLHPLSGEVLAAIWSTGNVISPQPPIPGQSRVDSSSEPEWSWRQGPVRPRHGDSTNSQWHVGEMTLALEGPERVVKLGGVTP